MPVNGLPTPEELEKMLSEVPPAPAAPTPASAESSSPAPDTEAPQGLPTPEELEQMLSEVPEAPLPSPDELETMVSQVPEPEDDEPLVGVTAAGALEDFKTGAKKGIDQEIRPFSDVAQNANKIRSWTQLAGEMTGGIGANLIGTAVATGLGAGIGALTPIPGGAMLGGFLGNALYSAYSGVGTESLQAKEYKRDFSPTKAAARTLLNMNPLARVNASGIKAIELAATKAGGTTGKVLSAAGKAAAASEKVAPRVVRGVGQVAGEAALAADDAGLTGGVIAGTLSALGVAPMFTKANITPSPGLMQAQQEFLTSPVGRDLDARVAARVQKELPEKIEIDRFDQLYDPEFMRYVLSAPMKGETTASLKGQSEEVLRAKMDDLLATGEKGGIGEANLNDLYKGFLVNNIQKEEASKTYLLQQKRLTDAMMEGSDRADNALDDPLSGEALGRLNRWVPRMSQVARMIDNKAGTNLGRTVDEVSERLNIFHRTASALSNQAIDAIKSQKKIGLTNEDMGRLRAAISEKDRSLLTPELARIVTPDFQITDKRVDRAVRSWDRVWENSRKAIEDYGFKVGKIENYLPMRMLPRELLAVQIRRSMDDIRGLRELVEIGTRSKVDDVSKLTVDDIMKAGKAKGITEDQAAGLLSERDSIIQMMEKAMGPGAKRQMTPDELDAWERLPTEAKMMQFAKAMVKETGAKGMGFEMSALYTRGAGSIPAKFRDLDIGRAYRRYLNLNVRGAMMDDQYRKIRDTAEMLDAAKLKDSASHIREWLAEMTGEYDNTGLAGAFSAGARQYRYVIEKFFDRDDLKGTALGEMGREAALFLPDLMSKANAAVYPAYLGLNVRNAVRGLAQPLQTTVPELGGTYGMETVTSSYMEALKTLKSRNGKISWKAMEDELDKIGLLGRGPLEQLDERGIAGIESHRVNNALMLPMTWGDNLNRWVTYNVGRKWGSDLVAGDARAIDSLTKMDPAVRSMLKASGIKEAMESGDAEKVGDVLGKYLVSKTMFHYGSEAKSKAQRFLGPLGMFTTWPSEMVGNLMATAQNTNSSLDKMRRFTQYFIQPALGVYSLAYLLELDGEKPGLARYLLGGDIESQSPLSTALSANIGSALETPVPAAIGTVLGAAKEAINKEKDPDQKGKPSVDKAMKGALKTYAGPISSVVNELDRYEKNFLGNKEGVSDVAVKRVKEGARKTAKDFWEDDSEE